PPKQSEEKGVEAIPSEEEEGEENDKEEGEEHHYCQTSQ
ncbi:hypothetical protein A2U01_0090381, partial [Trifolium medium]|nr:hypothetical protein [Trifolium medium]